MWESLLSRLRPADALFHGLQEPLISVNERSDSVPSDPDSIQGKLDQSIVQHNIDFKHIDLPRPEANDGNIDVRVTVERKPAYFFLNQSRAQKSPASGRATFKDDPGDKEQVIDKIKQMHREYKVLVLGAGGVGKSTLVQHMQMDSLGNTSFPTGSYNEIIMGNVLTWMKDIFMDVEPSELSYSCDLTAAKRLTATLPEGYEDTIDRIEEVGEIICTLWNMPELRELVRRGSTRLGIDPAPDSAE